ncbi:MAG: porin family protein [Myxococcales bacterium]|nr:porin family protein [Myxococcales bacterium]
MRARRWLFFLVLLLLLPPLPARAQRGGRVSILGNVGALWPQMEHQRTSRFDTPTALLTGALLNYGITDHAGIQFGLLSSEMRVRTDRNHDNTMTAQEIVTCFRWNVLTDLIQPYMLLGANYYIISLDPPLEDESDPGLIGGIGLEAVLTDHVSFGAVGRYSYLFADHFDSATMFSGLFTLAFTF